MAMDTAKKKARIKNQSSKNTTVHKTVLATKVKVKSVKEKYQAGNLNIESRKKYHKIYDEPKIQKIISQN